MLFKHIPKLYLFAFLLTIVLSIAFNFSFIMSDDKHIGLYLLISGGLFLNIPLVLVSIPGLLFFIQSPDEKSKAFAVSTIPLTMILIWVVAFSGMDGVDRKFYAITLIAFLIVLSYLFFGKPNRKKIINNVEV
jgi:lipoprotein signal peptidase